MDFIVFQKKGQDQGRRKLYDQHRKDTRYVDEHTDQPIGAGGRGRNLCHRAVTLVEHIENISTGVVWATVASFFPYTLLYIYIQISILRLIMHLKIQTAAFGSKLLYNQAPPGSRYQDELQLSLVAASKSHTTRVRLCLILC